MRKFIFALMLFTFMACSSQALMIKLDIPTLVRESDDILLGKVTFMESLWNTEDNLIYTYVTLETSLNLKSVITDGEVVLRIPGGEARGLMLMVSDTPRFEVGEDVIVFTLWGESGNFEVTEGFQGKFTVMDGKIIENGIQLEKFLTTVQSQIF